MRRSTAESLRAWALSAALGGALVSCVAPAMDPVVAAGIDHSCDLYGGVARCWGHDGFGQLGGDELRLMRRLRGLGAGGNTTCVIDEGGELWCFGQNHHGQLGDGTLNASSEPVRVAGLPPVAEVSVAFAHVCARGARGTVCCWGWGASGQLVPDGDEDAAAPICRELDARRVVAGFDTTCVIDSTDRLECWGSVAISPVDGARDVAIGADHVCVLRDEEVSCYGSVPGGDRPSIEGALSLGFSGGQLASGSIDHVCVADALGALHCFGKNDRGQLGDGTLVRRDEPREVRLLPAPVSSVAVGYAHTCAAAAGQTWCWGWNERGQLGDATGTQSLDPFLVGRGSLED